MREILLLTILAILTLGIGCELAGEPVGRLLRLASIVLASVALVLFLV